MGCRSSSRGGSDSRPARVYYVPKYRDQYVNICSFFIIRLFTDYFYLLTSCEAVNLEMAPFGDVCAVPRRHRSATGTNLLKRNLLRDDRVKKFIVF